MEYVLLSLTAFFASGLTLFSGFGLGTLVLPVFALFFPVEIAVASTAVVHLASNIFKLTLLGRYASSNIIFRFGIPALLASFFGAHLLGGLAAMKPLLTYSFAGREATLLPVNLVVAFLMAFFALLEARPQLERFHLRAAWLPVGGLLSGFFGGLSGHQGAFRSAFLLHAGLDPKSFIGTGVAIACLVDVTRIFAYTQGMRETLVQQDAAFLLAPIFAALLGNWIASRWVTRISFRSLRTLVAALLFVIAILLATGLLSLR